MPPEDNRRVFIKKSIAASASLTFAGLIRAGHGATTYPFQSTTPFDTTVPSPFNPFTLPNESTIIYFSTDPITDPPIVTTHVHDWQRFPVPESNWRGETFWRKWCTGCPVYEPPY